MFEKPAATRQKKSNMKSIKWIIGRYLNHFLCPTSILVFCNDFKNRIGWKKCCFYLFYQYRNEIFGWLHSSQIGFWPVPGIRIPHRCVDWTPRRSFCDWNRDFEHYRVWWHWSNPRHLVTNRARRSSAKKGKKLGKYICMGLVKDLEIEGGQWLCFAVFWIELKW